MTALAACGGSGRNDAALVAEGKQTLRFDTFGDETKWTDALRMHEVVAAIDPTTALAVGLRVDSEALPAAVVAGIQAGTVSLTDPATTVALLRLNAVLGVRGTVETIAGKDTLTRVGITCALCPSTVDNSFAQGIGRRLDGWPNRDLMGRRPRGDRPSSWEGLPAPRATAEPSSPTPRPACILSATRWASRNQLGFPATRRAVRPSSIGRHP